MNILYSVQQNNILLQAMQPKNCVLYIYKLEYKCKILAKTEQVLTVVSFKI